MSNWSRKAARMAMVIALIATTGACARLQGPMPGDFQPTLPPPPPPPVQTGGAIYQAGYDMRLFDDPKARRVGDVLTVQLVERTAASKSASTGTNKDTSIDTGNPIIGGDTITLNDEDILNNSWEQEHSFKGEGSSSQSNRLDGNISVTVADVYPNGNLAVRGEKWITLNQGQEYVYVTGIVRPQDILPDNTVLSTRIADARITYSGKGTLAEANKVGWFSRFFMSPVWPL